MRPKMNFLEALAAEWYEYIGYFVRSNIKTRKRNKGGWDSELDVLAFLPKTQELLHVETSGDAISWAERKEIFESKKFIISDEEYNKDIVGSEIKTIRRIAIVGYQKTTQADLNWGNGIEVILIPDFFQNISRLLITKDPMKEAVLEGLPLLRSMQMLLWYGKMSA